LELGAILRSTPVASIFGVAALIMISGGGLKAQVSNNPYHVIYNWDKIESRKIGVASGFKMDPDGKHLWILDRCGANGCADSDLDPIIEVGLDGKLIKSFGKSLISFPHGVFVDRQGNVWVTDGAAAGDPRGEAGFKKHMGHQVFKFSPDGKVLMTLGQPGVSGADETHFNGPTGVVVGDNGDIWITDGHGGAQTGPNKDNMFGSRGGNNRLVRFSKNGKFIKAWGGGIGSEGAGPLQFNDPHDIAIDPSDGRLYIADRGNDRVQVLDKDGNFITRWTQFGKPGAIAIDDKGNIYVADGMSDSHWNPGWERGIRVADVKTGWIKAFIPDEEATRGAGTEFLGVDPQGNIYSGASGRPGLVVHELFRPLY
jgi:DNA-binding beta-propeller fold protein YncE